MMDSRLLVKDAADQAVSSRGLMYIDPEEAKRDPSARSKTFVENLADANSIEDKIDKTQYDLPRIRV